MIKQLPQHPNFEHLRKQAKDLLSEMNQGEESALHRVNAFHPRAMGSNHSFSLTDAQLILAREYGFESWPKLKERLCSTRPDLNLVLQDLREGKLCILFDDETRENEGDFVLAAEKVTPQAINFMTKHGRGTLCLSLTSSHANKLGLSLINPLRENLAEPAFTVSIDASNGITTGVSAFDKAHTIQSAVSDHANPSVIKSPGHVFPLKAHEGGIRSRSGHTEGSIELMRLSGLKPAAVICEILSEDGTMARWPDLLRIAEAHQIQMVRISDLQ